MVSTIQKNNPKLSPLYQRFLQLVQDALAHGVDLALQNFQKWTSTQPNQEAVIDAMSKLGEEGFGDAFWSQLEQEQAMFFSETGLWTIEAFVQKAVKHASVQTAALVKQSQLIRVLVYAAAANGIPAAKVRFDEACKALSAFKDAPHWNDAHQVLQSQQQILLSDEAILVLQWKYLQLQASTNRSHKMEAEILGPYLSILEMARERGIDAAWKAHQRFFATTNREKDQAGERMLYKFIRERLREG